MEHLQQRLEGDVMRGAVLDCSGLESTGHGRDECDHDHVVRWQPTSVPTGARRYCAKAGHANAGRARCRPPGPARPAGGALRYRGTGVATTRGCGVQRPSSTTAVTTFALALAAALITAWLGVVAQFSDLSRTTATPALDRLAVVRVQSGETLQHLAARVAPGAPVGKVVERIQELNELESTALEAGRTLIAPIG